MANQPEAVENLYDGMQWQVAALRLTTFLGPETELDTSVSWWEKVTNKSPELQNNNIKLHQKSEKGIFNDITLSFDLTLGRVDWQVTGLPIDQPTINSASDFQPISNLLPILSEVASRWLTVAPPVMRLAFGAQLGIPVADRTSGYQLLSKYLSTVAIDPEGSSDFSFQINRPRRSLITPDLKINRLSKWSVLIFTTTSLLLQNDNPVSSQRSSSFNSCFLDMDINTSATNTKEFSQDQSKAYFIELRDLGLEIAKSGDIK